YPVTLWPVEVGAAVFESSDPVGGRGKWEKAEIRISLRCINNTKLSELKAGRDEKAPLIDRLRLYLSGEPQLVYPLYEAIFNDAVQVELRPKNGQKVGGRNAPSPIKLPASSLKTVGFEADEGLLGYTARSFVGYRLLTEYFAFPDKFLFFD